MLSELQLPPGYQSVVCLIGCALLHRQKQVVDLNVQGLGDFEQGNDRRVALPIFKFAEILLAKAGLLRDLALAQVSAEAGISNVHADCFAHIHSRISTDGRLDLYLL